MRDWSNMGSRVVLSRFQKGRGQTCFRSAGRSVKPGPANSRQRHNSARIKSVLFYRLHFHLQILLITNLSKLSFTPLDVRLKQFYHSRDNSFQSGAVRSGANLTFRGPADVPFVKPPRILRTPHPLHALTDRVVRCLVVMMASNIHFCSDLSLGFGNTGRDANRHRPIARRILMTGMPDREW